MTVDRKKSNSRDLIICILTTMILVGILYFILNIALGLNQVVHTYEMQELELEKEIALINNNQTQPNITYNTCEEELRSLHNCLYYEPSTNTYYESVCYLMNQKGEVYR